MPRTRKTALSVSLGAVLVLGLFAVSGCDCNNRRDRREVTAVQHAPRNRPPVKRTERTKRTTNVQSQQFLMDADAFDLEAVVSLMTNEGVTDMEALEQRINDPDSGINNVDINSDEQTDYVGCSEVNEDGRRAVDFIAYPSGVDEPADDDLVTVASISITVNTETNQVEVSGGYPEYVSGYQDRHYSHHVSRSHSHGSSGFATGFFLGYFLAPRPLYRPVYYGVTPYGYMGGGFYSPRPVVSVTVINTRRSGYRTSHASSFRSSPRRMSRPSGYNIPRAQRSASKVRSRYSDRGGVRGATKRPTKSGSGVRRSKAPRPPAAHRPGSAGRSKSPARPSTSRGSKRGGSSYGSTPRRSTPPRTSTPRRSTPRPRATTPRRSSGGSYGSGGSSRRRGGGSYGGGRSRGRRR